MLCHHRLVRLLMFYLEHNQLKNSLICYETGSHVTGTDLENSLAEGLEAISFVLELLGGVPHVAHKLQLLGGVGGGRGGSSATKYNFKTHTHTLSHCIISA